LLGRGIVRAGHTGERQADTQRKRIALKVFVHIASPRDEKRLNLICQWARACAGGCLSNRAWDI
jgi:sulfatase maturation enzyme AslB (radical SAM superfamily)